jgi:hypothetical protein
MLRLVWPSIVLTGSGIGPGPSLSGTGTASGRLVAANLKPPGPFVMIEGRPRRRLDAAAVLEVHVQAPLNLKEGGLAGCTEGSL